MKSEIFDHRRCELGEGPFWHPERQQLFWFDIIGGNLHTVEDGAAKTWSFDRHASAAGWVSQDELLIATERDLVLFNLTTGEEAFVAELDADNPDTRSNDGRADPWGGFWIGTMGKSAQPQAGGIHRFFRGELRLLYPRITIPNAICFSPSGDFAYFADTATRQVLRQSLDPANGWPQGDPEVWLDLTAEGLNPDGAVVDAQGNLWNAQWGAARVACYDPMGHFIEAISFDAVHTSCPAFGGPKLSTLFCTTAMEALDEDELSSSTAHGKTFVAEDVATGQREHQVIL